MAKTEKPKPSKKIAEVLSSLDDDRKAAGGILSDAELAFIVKLVKAAE